MSQDDFSRMPASCKTVRKSSGKKAEARSSRIVAAEINHQESVGVGV